MAANNPTRAPLAGAYRLAYVPTDMADPTLDNALDRADAALARIEKALASRPDGEAKLRAEMRAVLADLDALLANAERD